MKEPGQTSKPTCIGCRASQFMMIVIIGSYLLMYVSSLLKDDTTQPAAQETPAGMVLVKSDESQAPDAFFLDRRDVTNAEFAEFVSETGYITRAEESGDDHNWREPSGTASKAETNPDHPVIALNRADAEAYASWSGKRLLSDSEILYARKAGLLADNSSLFYADEYSENTLSSHGFRCAADVTLTSH